MKLSEKRRLIALVFRRSTVIILSVAVIVAVASASFWALRANASAYVGRLSPFSHTTSNALHTDSGPTLTYSAHYLYPGGAFLLKGGGYTTLERVAITFDSTPIGSAQVTALGIAGSFRGVFIAALAVPATAQPGLHTIQAVGEQSGATGQLSLTVEANWGEWNFAPQGGRNNPYETTIGVSNVATLAPMWKAGNGLAIYSHSTPILDDGIIYSLADSTAYPQAFDESTGVQFQGFSAYSPITAPALANGKMFYGSQDDTFKASTVSNGASSPLWTYPQDGTGACQFTVPPTVAGDLVYTGDSCGDLFAFTTGACTALCAPVWEAHAAGQFEDNSPAVANGDVYIGTSTGSIAIFDAQTGAALYSDTSDGDASRAVAVVNGDVYSTNSKGRLEVFDAAGCGQATCPPLWTAQTGGRIFTAPAVGDGVVFVTTYDKQLYAYSASGCGQSTCSPLWMAATLSPIYSSPTVANGVVYIGSNDDYIYAFNTAGCGQSSCTPLWKYNLGSNVWSSPTVVNGTLYIDGGPGFVFAFRPTSSSQKRVV